MSFRLRVLQIQRVAQSLQRHIVGVLQILHRVAKHFGPGPHHLFQALLVVVALFQQLAVLQCALHCAHQVVALEWLEQIVVRTAPHGVDGYTDVMDCGHHYHGKVRLLRMNPLQQRNAVQVLHHDVGEYQIVGVERERFQRFPATRCQLHLVTTAFQGRTHHGTDVGFIVHHKNARRSGRFHNRLRFCVSGWPLRGVRHVR